MLVDEALALSLLGVASVSLQLCFDDSILSVNFMFDMQVATHLKGLAERPN